MMSIDFSVFLFFGTISTGVICVVNKYFWRPQRVAALSTVVNDNSVVDKEPLLVEYARSFFPVLLLVFLLRSFWLEPFRIPSGSMKPTLLVGDFIVVNKYEYGIRLPIIHKKILELGKPARGDVLVFRYPVNPTENFIKRVIGLPGDSIDYVNKQLYINGVLMTKSAEHTQTLFENASTPITVKSWSEDLGERVHQIYERPTPGREVRGLKVPAGHYFVMGDNRDDSDDSRAWGFVPEENIVGKAKWVWMSWDNENFRVRTDTIPRSIL